jgi:hypothetical protein
MMRLSAAAFAALVLAAPVTAQELLGEYYSSISASDMRGSGGAPLSDWCAMIRQDRANYHRFGVRDDGDQGDPFFGSPENRASLDGSCRVAPGSEYIPEWLESGRTRFVRVQIFGSGGVPDHVLVSEGAG